MGSIYKSKWQQLREQAAYYAFKAGQGGEQVKNTARTMAWASNDVNRRMEAANENTFGRTRKGKW